MPHVITASYNGNPNIGLFCYANDKYCLVPYDFTPKQKAEFEKILKVPVHQLNAAGTSLLGVFFNGNEDVLLVPEIMFESELQELGRLGINYRIVNSELTALGNNLLIMNKAGIASPEYSDAILKDIEKELGIALKKGKIANIDTVGALARGNKKGLLVSPEIQQFERQFLEHSLKVKITAGTLNFGSPYVSSGIVCNSHGFIIGSFSGGPEIQNADEALGFI